MSGWEKYAVDKCSQLAKVTGWQASRGREWVGKVSSVKNNWLVQVCGGQKCGWHKYVVISKIVQLIIRM